MEHLSYSTRTAFHSLMKEKWINLLSSLTVAASLLVSAMAIITIFNLESFTRTLPARFTMVVYLQDSISAEDTRSCLRNLRMKIMF